jgi:hypothetical protein
MEKIEGNKRSILSDVGNKSDCALARSEGLGLIGQYCKIVESFNLGPQNVRHGESSGE